jgi:hypothetical protein
MSTSKAYTERFSASEQAIIAAKRRIADCEPRMAVRELNEAIKHLCVLRNWQKAKLEAGQH